MSHVYVLTNQHKQFLSKSNEWIDGRDVARLFRSEHKDVAINQMFEANTRDVSLRIELLECALNAKGHPQIPEEALGEPPVLADAEQGDPEVTPGGPEEVPPGSHPEVNPEPAPEAEPQEPPEVAPQEAPEIQPGQPDETRNQAAETAG
ncbi:hypothetical protein [Microbulbifer thermotolerans]|uniref:Uncharacterized protein n=1 Tax=Microbulbifer thermotolerans TaxID=252514 RepID=A0AB35HW52_MICTH|nr:hypothetical protein [Microbulbifer thermotolerans]MCX2778663.1 hypothetical protein [Microbulbifer thermotolerans]MCX2794133.1 hypothetical protein [Microbulbifer thermotolerans]MCX2801624.1 hypothetical protein [Microbulbifer thermotolerans]MCX2803828.1 hypothetical protein [Microbulbifer thermotolerans]MCX2830671.1 hypothetical protein [Microbulbifer thermotolerans]